MPRWWIRPCRRIQDKNTRWIEAMAIQILRKQRNSRDSVGKRGTVPQQKLVQVIIRQWRKNRQAARVSEQSVKRPVASYPRKHLVDMQTRRCITRRNCKQQRLIVRRKSLIHSPVEYVVYRLPSCPRAYNVAGGGVGKLFLPRKESSETETAGVPLRP